MQAREIFGNMASANVGDLSDKYSKKLSGETKDRLSHNNTNIKTRNFLRALLYGTHFAATSDE